MGFLYRKETDGIVITGCEGSVSYLQIPEEWEGLPVLGVEKSAFARRQELLFVQLPRSLRFLGRFAFYGCGRLERAVLGSVADYGDGVFRQCGALREVRLELSGDFTVLRDLLADRDTTLRVELSLPQGEAFLTFPDYLMDFDEDTRARALHTRIEGAGFAYRECVTRKGIDLRAYDRTFGRICRTEPATAVQIALDRLLTPLGLEEPAKRAYEDYLRETGEQAVGQAVASRREYWLRLLLDRGMLTAGARETGLRLARDAGETAMVALLMQSAPAAARRFCL